MAAEKLTLQQKILETSTISTTDILENSDIFNDRDVIPTSVPMINLALSGSVDGGLTAGLTVIAGVSKNFKSGFALFLASQYLKKYPDGVILFYINEFGTPKSYFDMFGISLKSVVLTPVTNIEELKFDIAAQLAKLKKGDRVFIMVDSIGNIASKKEVEDAMDQKSSADMTRAKQLKSLFRIVTPHLPMKNIPMVVINHTYQTQEMYSKPVVSGGCVAAGTRVKMADGTLLPMECMSVGSSVVTLDGDMQVTHVWNPETLCDGTPRCFEVEFEDGYKVTVSEDHQFMMDDGSWKLVSDISDRDKLMIC